MGQSEGNYLFRNCQLPIDSTLSVEHTIFGTAGTSFAFVVVMMFVEQAEDGFPLLSLLCGSVAIVCLSVY